MGYTAKHWTNLNNFQASHLNEIELGLQEAHEDIDVIQQELTNVKLTNDSTIKEINDLLTNSESMVDALKELEKLSESNSDIAEFLSNYGKDYLTKTSQSLSKEELKVIYQNLKLVDAVQSLTPSTDYKQIQIHNESYTSHQDIREALSDKASIAYVDSAIASINIPDNSGASIEEHNNDSASHQDIRDMINNIDLSEYSKTNHTHSQYSSITHTHTNYSDINHNHNGEYSPLDHSHEDYLTQENLEEALSNIDVNMCEEITYDNLVALRNSNSLTTGKTYRIIDYVTVIDEERSWNKDVVRSACHGYDILVQATSSNSLSHNAKAALRKNDTYFANNKIDSWILKYSLDNDSETYQWASPNIGKGVVYYMKDEFENECYYDFKNIMYKGSALDQKGQNLEYTYANLNMNSEDYYYTFHSPKLDIKDFSLHEGCHGNKIMPVFNHYYGYQLNQIVFYVNFTLTNTYDCADNFFDSDCSRILLGDRCSHNIFGKGCVGMFLGNACRNNTFLGGNSYSSLEGYCTYNTFNRTAYRFTMGKSCSYNTIGTNCSYFTLASYIQHCVLEPGITKIKFTRTEDSTDIIQNVTVESGVSGYYFDPPGVGNEKDYILELYDECLVNKPYSITISRDSNDKLSITWYENPTKLVGKYKETLISEEWLDIPVETIDLSGEFNTHNNDATAHQDIRNLIKNIDLSGYAPKEHNHDGVYAPFTHSHDYATPSYVDTAIANLVGAAPDALNTFEELAAALNNNKDILSTFLTKNNPSGTGSLSLNRKANTTIGTNSVALGTGTQATGNSSHAEGYQSKALADYAHAEGYQTAAYGSSHAEGYLTIARNGYAHTEGYNTHAFGMASHAEGGYTYTTSSYAHAEGKGSKSNPYFLVADPLSVSGYYITFALHEDSKNNASHLNIFNAMTRGDLLHISQGGNYYLYRVDSIDLTNQTMVCEAVFYKIDTSLDVSKLTTNTIFDGIAIGAGAHCEGIGTIACGYGQHVFGIGNIVDSNYSNPSRDVVKGDYIEIVGNGTYTSAKGVTKRSNARTLDWDGNEWLAGGLTTVGAITEAGTLLSDKYAAKEHTHTEFISARYDSSSRILYVII